jgi:hypothetical protein
MFAPARASKRYKFRTSGMKKYLLLTFIVLLAACEKPSICTKHYFSDNYKSYVYASPGSYWVFEDTLLGIKDSVYVVSQTVQFNDECTVSFQPQEQLEQHLISSFFIGDYNYNWNASGNAEGNWYYASYILGWYSENMGKAIDSMLVQGIWYKDILEFTSSNSKYFRAKEVGLIKKEFSLIGSNDTTIYHFELKNYYLNK